MLFSVASWGQTEPGPVRAPRVTAELVLHEMGHASFGAVVAFPTLRVVPIMAAAIGAVLFDADHIGYYMGLPMHGRASHSAIFIASAFVIAYLLARRGFFGRYVPPLMTASLAAASISAHLAYDAITGDGFPIWSPFFYGKVLLTPAGGALAEIAAIALVWAVTKRAWAVTKRA